MYIYYTFRLKNIINFHLIEIRFTEQTNLICVFGKH